MTSQLTPAGNPWHRRLTSVPTAYSLHFYGFKNPDRSHRVCLGRIGFVLATEHRYGLAFEPTYLAELKSAVGSQLVEVCSNRTNVNASQPVVHSLLTRMRELTGFRDCVLRDCIWDALKPAGSSVSSDIAIAPVSSFPHRSLPPIRTTERDGYHATHLYLPGALELSSSSCYVVKHVASSSSRTIAYVDPRMGSVLLSGLGARLLRAWQLLELTCPSYLCPRWEDLQAHVNDTCESRIIPVICSVQYAAENAEIGTLVEIICRESKLRFYVILKDALFQGPEQTVFLGMTMGHIRTDCTSTCAVVIPKEFVFPEVMFHNEYSQPDFQDSMRLLKDELFDPKWGPSHDNVAHSAAILPTRQCVRTHYVEKRKRVSERCSCLKETPQDTL